MKSKPLVIAAVMGLVAAGSVWYGLDTVADIPVAEANAAQLDRRPLRDFLVGDWSFEDNCNNDNGFELTAINESQVGKFMGLYEEGAWKLEGDIVKITAFKTMDDVGHLVPDTAHTHEWRVFRRGNDLTVIDEKGQTKKAMRCG